MTNWFKNLFVSKNNILLPKVSETDIIEVRKFALNGWKLGETHGLSHWQRVERNGILLSTENGSIRKDVDLKVVRFFAYLHDKCRLNDWADLEHGVRSQRKRTNAKCLFFSNTHLLDKIISAAFGRIC